MNKAWIAFPLLAVALVGCKSDTEPVSQVPPPNYSAEPEPLPPLAVEEGSPNAIERGTGSGTFAGPTTGSGTYEPEPLPPAPPATKTYTIKKGDTFIGLARRLYGDESKWKDIAQLNPSVDPRKLMIGQQIILP